MGRWWAKKVQGNVPEGPRDAPIPPASSMGDKQYARHFSELKPPVGGPMRARIGRIIAFRARRTRPIFKDDLL
jgi:hypothetical protein